MRTFKEKISLGLWTTSVILIGILFVSFLGKYIPFQKIDSRENSALAIQSFNQDSHFDDYQKNYFNKNPGTAPKVSALAYLVGDIDTGEIILSKNEKEQYPLASVSKLMTATIASGMVKQDNMAVVSKKALSTYGQNGNFRAGEKVKVQELLYPLLLESSNDAAEIIAEYFKRDTFIKKMNQLALSLDLSKTTFEDPSGLSTNNKSSVLDMFKLAGYISQTQPDLFQMTTKKSYTNKTHSWFSNNQFLGENGYLGGKSGYTDPAKQTVVSLFSLPLGETGMRHISITLLQSKDRFKDVEAILKYLNKNIYYGGETDANRDWVTQRTDLPIVYEQDFVNLVFGGDIMLDRGVRNSVNKNFKGDYSALFEKLKILKKADISFANLEGPASNNGKDLHNLYSFRMDPSVIPALKGAGFSILSVANNHVGDWGRVAYADTLVHLKENELAYTGGGLDKNEAEEPAIIEKYGIKIGYLGFSDVGPNWMASDEDQAGILLANNPRFGEIIKKASAKVDYLVVSIHFGDEYKEKHNKRQEYLAHKAIDSGAKIVIGHHPHVAEDTEIYKNGFIVYSLGNFVFDQTFSKNTMQGMILEVNLNRDGNMTIKKDIVKLNKYLQPDQLIQGKEEKIQIKKAVN